nr:endoglucanase-like [Leptinotarsa decemlineata]
MKRFVVLLITVAFFDASTGEPSPEIIPVEGGLSGDGITTRYWDCCKPSCGWTDLVNNTRFKTPVHTCAIDGIEIIDPQQQSGCADVGAAYTCSNQQPFVVNSTLAYGFSAVSFTGGEDYHMCCSCMLLNFQGQLSGKKMLVQITNTGSPLAVNQFDIELPGGGVGIYPHGCMKQWNASETGWGDTFGGVHSDAECSELPAVLQPGCHFRFQFMEGVSNPPVTFQQVQCPRELVAITGCEY